VGRQDVGSAVWDDINQLFTATFHIDENGRILQCSPLIKRFFSAEGALDGSFFDLFSFNRPSAFKGTYGAAKASAGKLFLGFNEAQGFAIRGQILDLSQHGLEGLCFVGVPWLWWIEANNPKAGLTLADFPIHDVQMDQLFFMSAQQTMVDDLQLVNDELSLAQQKVEKLSASRVEHFRHISHEMRTPLSGIISALTLLKDKQHDDRSHELIRLANYSASRLLEVINYTLDSAALDAGESGGESEAFDLNVMIDESLALVQAKALEKGIELRRAGQQYFATSYHGRPKLLRQVLSNLLGNAIKFATGGPSSCLHRLKNPVRTMLRS
jgi:signal transduction histidine kinase